MLNTMLVVTLMVVTLDVCLCIPVDDPSQWPGHLEPFGSKQKTIDIDTHYYWSSPKEFFKEYVDETKPALFKGVYKNSKGIHLWNDEYLHSNDLSANSMVQVEPNIKENRTTSKYKSIQMSFRKFIETYHEKPILMFSTMPDHFMKDILLPPPLKCDETREHLVNANLVFSRGGSKSVVHNEDVETIYCAMQGTVDTLLIEYTKNRNYVIDRPQGGYSTLDVDRVDYVEHSQLRKVDQYVRAHMEEGDCLYIPFRWYKQQNSFANRMNRSLALNFWFSHLHDHAPVDCSIPDEQATVDKFEFIDLKARDEGHRMAGKVIKVVDTVYDVPEGMEEEEEMEKPLYHLTLTFQIYLNMYKSRNASFFKFYRILIKDERLTHQSHKGLKFPKTFQTLAVELFEKLDVTNDTFLTVADFDAINSNPTKAKNMEQYLEYQTARIEDYVEDLVEAKHHNEPLHVFEERMKEKFHSARYFGEL